MSLASGERYLGINEHGKLVYASELLIAKYGLEKVKIELGVMRQFPVRTDLSGNTVMVYANSQEEAIDKWLNAKARGQE